MKLKFLLVLVSGVLAESALHADASDTVGVVQRENNNSRKYRRQQPALRNSQPLLRNSQKGFGDPEQAELSNQQEERGDAFPANRYGPVNDTPWTGGRGPGMAKEEPQSDYGSAVPPMGSHVRGFGATEELL